MTEYDEHVYWLALSEKPWLVPAEKAEQAYRDLGSLVALWDAPVPYLQGLDLSEAKIREFSAHKSQTNLLDFSKQLENLRKRGIRVIKYIDQNYPARLKQSSKSLEGPPLVILHKGTLLDFDRCVAIVGTRDCSFHGRVMARRLAKALSSKGYTIVSGLARGVDVEVHCGALEARKGTTIAVLAWIDPIYPAEHTQLARDIEKRGSLLSERFTSPFGKVAPSRFVERNRITSGISRCVIAIESDIEGGTVHQVDYALAQGREVFALIPANNDRARRGFELFIGKGASPLKNVDDVLEYLKHREESEKVRRIEQFYESPQRTLV